LSFHKTQQGIVEPSSRDGSGREEKGIGRIGRNEEKKKEEGAVSSGLGKRGDTLNWHCERREGEGGKIDSILPLLSQREGRGVSF